MLSSLVFSCTYKCPAKCRYCGAQAGPEQSDRLSLDEIVQVIDDVYSYGKLELVVFTGGEPFLLGRDLLGAVEYCASKELLTRIVTNAYWAKSAADARKVVDRYKNAGLSEINISCDDYHQEFIPLERIRHANNACLSSGMPCLIGHKIMKGHKLSIEYLEEYLGQKLARFDSETRENPSNNVVSSGYNVPVEDDMHLIPDNEILYPPSDQHWKSPCSSVLQRIIVTPKKELSICCGMIPRSVPEIFFGELDNVTLEELIATANGDLIANWLALEGPYGLMKFIQEKRPDIKFRSNYVNICHLCSEILTRKDCREILLEHAHEKAPEIAMERNLYDLMRSEKEFDVFRPV